MASKQQSLLTWVLPVTACLALASCGSPSEACKGILTAEATKMALRAKASMLRHSTVSDQKKYASDVIESVSTGPDTVGRGFAAEVRFARLMAFIYPDCDLKWSPR